ncbi:MAG TPA: hypothetical protein VGI74_03105 [Streptosporangiaceae bacterium]
MTAWSSQITERFKVLLNFKDISDETDDEGVDGDDHEVKLKRVAIARNRNPHEAEAAHEALAALAFSGYQDWCEYDDDDWTKNCLCQVLDDDQSGFLASVLEDAGLIDLTTAIELMAGPYRTAWQQAAETEAAQSGSEVGAAALVPAENLESWRYSRTPGTRYYIFYEGQYLYSDDKDAPLAGWATAEARDDQAAARATEWESGSGVFYTDYENPAHAGGVTHVFGRSKDGPWVLTREQAGQLLATSPQSQLPAGAGSPIEPYFGTGHFTKYDNGTYFFGQTADTATWYRTYQELLDALAARAAPAAGGAEALQKLLEAVPEARGLSEQELADAIIAATA